MTSFIIVIKKIFQFFYLDITIHLVITLCLFLLMQHTHICFLRSPRFNRSIGWILELLRASKYDFKQTCLCSHVNCHTLLITSTLSWRSSFSPVFGSSLWDGSCLWNYLAYKKENLYAFVETTINIKMHLNPSKFCNLILLFTSK